VALNTAAVNVSVTRINKHISIQLQVGAWARFHVSKRFRSQVSKTSVILYHPTITMELFFISVENYRKSCFYY